MEPERKLRLAQPTQLGLGMFLLRSITDGKGVPKVQSAEHRQFAP